MTRHLLTNADVIRLFLPVEIRIYAPLGEPADIEVRPSAAPGEGHRQ